MKHSIIIPTLNEEEKISHLLEFLTKNALSDSEIIVVDGGSKDKTIALVKRFENVNLIETKKASRAYQLNEGAKKATGELLYFIHADVLPPQTFEADIEIALQKEYEFGCYRFVFDKNAIMLKFNAWWTRFDFMFCRGGDQTLFVTKDVFNQLNGFDEHYIIMEDFDFILRARKKFKFRIIPKNVVVSARKYKLNSYFKVNMVNLYSYWSFMLGKSPEKIRDNYKTWLKFD
ncbi:TIGR04283 family arsenosugar biosynthesis glycosyltransferase [Brumimicrobium oceani]|uniref:Glycosyl transferase n=1 Tax=Brumimicrobium oceani TaxID=2100725 RepID=A0A2U2XE28_9FLAO|nr:TIGR04283 family arsenosugar biosynthesis glycosyltransferase [Brumimicrobium oceani]PWH85997.1 glycosyl transferase [Brumimicrobium oceani]